MQPEVFRKRILLGYRKDTNDYAVFGLFSLFASIRQYKTQTSKLILFHELEWVTELNALSCRKSVWKTKKNIREINLKKRKVCVSKQELKALLWRTTYRIRKNHTYILITGTGVMFWPKRLWPFVFSSRKMIGISRQFFDETFLKVGILPVDTLIEVTNRQLLEESKGFPDKI